MFGKAAHVFLSLSCILLYGHIKYELLFQVKKQHLRTK